MSKFLVVVFNRYHTDGSSHTFLEATDHKDALKQSMDVPPGPMSDGFDEYEYKLSLDMFVQVDDTFACVSFEESDTLIYKVG